MQEIHRLRAVPRAQGVALDRDEAAAILHRMMRQLEEEDRGTKAPDFATPQGVAAAQARHRSQALVLIFYPMDWEPVSREQLSLYQVYSDTFNRLGAQLLGKSDATMACGASYRA